MTLLLNHLKHHGGVVCILVYEKKFVVDEVLHRRNPRVIAAEDSPFLPPANTKHLSWFSEFAIYEKVMSHHFIESGLEINTVEYLKILNEVLLPWMKKNYDSMKVIFIQDFATANRSETVQFFLK